MPRRSALLKLVIFLSVILVLAPSCVEQRKPTPPAASVQTRVFTLHDQTWEDDYFWLRERGTPAVESYLEAENAYAEAAMSHTAKLQEKLYNEFVGRIKETDLSVPEKDGDYFYYKRYEEGQQYPIHCRKRKSLDAAEEIILDENILAVGHDYLDVGTYQVSPDDKILAYSVDTAGREIYTIYFKDLSTGDLLADRIPQAYYSFEWCEDNRTVFYTTQDEAMRPYKLFRHKLGHGYENDDLLFHESDDAFEMYLSKSKSDKYLFLTLESMVTTEVHFLKADDCEGKFKVVHPRQHQMEYSVYHRDDKFYIRTNDGARNFKLMVTPVKKPGKDNWKEFVAHSDSVKIDALDVFDNHMVVYSRTGGLKQIQVMDLKSNASHYIEFPEVTYKYYRQTNPNFKSKVVRFTYASMVTPKTVYDYDMDERMLELKKEYEVLGGYDKTNYTVERIFATAADGRQVPISIVYRNGMVKNGDSPLLLYAYGAYGSSSDPGFYPKNVSLLDRGVIYAVAHVRGGGEMGRYWYEEGKLLNKRNTFSDFIVCAEHLIAQKYTSPERLIAEGVSAGGLTVGAVSNMRPDLFKAILAKVPFVDIINTMLDPSIPLTVIEWEEWGNPNEKAYFDYMMSYSPYDNVKARDYPNMLITAGYTDPRVQYWEPAKWTARLRANKTDNNLLLLKTQMGSGHFGASGRYDAFRKDAFEFAFILDAVGIKD